MEDKIEPTISQPMAFIGMCNKKSVSIDKPKSGGLIQENISPIQKMESDSIEIDNNISGQRSLPKVRVVEASSEEKDSGSSNYSRGIVKTLYLNANDDTTKVM